ncbi:MAG: SurA N-terminal domain-containing protein [Burkholderiales bacterium]
MSMLDWIRESTQGWIVKLILALIIVPFALFGIDSYFSHRASDDTIAIVNGAKISRTAYEEALKEQRAILAASMGANFDPRIFDEPKIRISVLNGMIKQRLLLEAAHDAGFVVSKAQLASYIGSIPAFQENGQFSVSRYKQMLQQQGMTIPGFEQRAQQEILIDDMRAPFSRAAVASAEVARQVMSDMTQRREISQYSISPSSFLAQITITPQEIKAYYDKHKTEYTIPAQGRFQYAVLSLNDVAKRISIPPAVIKQYYDQNLTKFSEPEEREARHILIAVPAGASAQQRDAARQRAERLYQQASAHPAAFAGLAKQYSDDKGSAAQGGELGWFARTAMVKPFADAVFGMQKNQIAGPVATDYGYHVIQLTGIRPAHVRPLDAVAGEITDELQKQQAVKQFADVAERFSNQVFEQSQTLQPIADALHIPLQTSPWISLSGGAAGILNSPKMLQALFSNDVLKNKRNTDAIEVSPNTLVSARLLEYKPSYVQTLNEVSASIEQQLKKQQAQALTQKQGVALLNQLNTGKEPAQIHWSGFTWVSRDHLQNTDPALVTGIFSANAKKLPAYFGAVNVTGNYILVRITQVAPGQAADPAQLKAVQTQMANTETEQAFSDYISGLSAKAKIVIKDIPFGRLAQ